MSCSPPYWRRRVSVDFAIALKRVRPEILLRTVEALCSETVAGVATNGELARRLDLSTGTVSSLLKRLAAEGLVFHEPYEGVRLTPAGLRTSRRLIRRRLLLQQFLEQTLSMPHVDAAHEATKLEFAASDRIIAAVDQALRHPEWTTVGEPIPREDGNLPIFVRLIECREGAIVRVQSIEGPPLSMIQGITMAPGVEISVQRSDSESGTINLSVNGRSLTLGHSIAQRILVVDTPSGLLESASG